jgi:hypothetical protein
MGRELSVCFLIKKKRRRERESIDLPSMFFKEERRERERGRERRSRK